MEVDERFSKLGKDPRYKKITKKERKVKIDSRFEKMFTDDRFHTKFSVDKRGKVLDETEKEDLHKFYEMDEDGVENNLPDKSSLLDGMNDSGNKNISSDDATKIKKKKGKRLATVTKVNFGSAHKRVSLGKRKKKKIKQNEDVIQQNAKEKIDFSDIRGETLADVSDSSSDDDDDTVVGDISEDSEITHGWGELDADVKRIENAETSRLAVCNCDWDRIGANDLYILFDSFKPVNGTIKSVKVYPSEFGIERMQEEEINGPKELRDSAIQVDDEPKEEGSSGHMEKLREYQLNRLRYYYAVVECDSSQTASKIYEECDGMEYEMSATRMDLRFIPDETTFDREPKSVATEACQLKNYEPAQFVNTALQQSSVRLTWDETDVRRVQTTMRQFTKEDIENMDFKDYLASSDEEEEEKIEGVNDEDRVGVVDKNEEERRIKIYREMMQGIEAKEEKENDKLDMEVSFKTETHTDADLKNGQPITSDEGEDNSGVKETTNSESEDISDGNESDDGVDVGDDEVGSDEELSSENDDVNDENLVSEDTGNVTSGFDDPFFDSALSGKKSTQKRKKKKKRRTLAEEVNESDQKSKKELELLLLDESEDKRHFSLQGILDAEKDKKSKRKRKKEVTETGDNFKLNVEDPRFSALYSSHLYAIDPSEPNFKKTKATQAIIEERQRRRKENENNTDMNRTSGEEKFDTKLSGLIKSVKSKTMQHNLKSQRKKLK